MRRPPSADQLPAKNQAFRAFLPILRKILGHRGQGSSALFHFPLHALRHQADRHSILGDPDQDEQAWSQRLPFVNTMKKFDVFLIVLTITASAICIRIEFLNDKAGHVLPRHEYRDDDPAQGLVTWR